MADEVVKRKGPGRPPKIPGLSSKRLTDAERKARQRKLDRDSTLSAKSQEALLADTGKAIQAGDIDFFDLLVKEMKRRVLANAKLL